MKTVFITCFTGLISRNILSTDVLDVLRKTSGVRVVILAPEKIADQLRQEFSGDRVSVEAVSIPALGGRDLLFWVLATNLLGNETRDVQRRAKFARDHNWLEYVLSKAIGFLGKARGVRQLFRAIVFQFESQAEFTSLFERYRPDLLFATDVYTLFDAKLMRLAAKRGVRTIGMVRSWDNITSKTLLTFIPEKMLISTEARAAELIQWADVPRGRIVFSGVPHYDGYSEKDRSPRGDFFRSFGLDPEKKLILFTPPSDNYLKHDPIAPVVLKALERVPAQTLVRQSLVGKTELGDYVPGASVAFDAPRNEGNFVEAHLSPEADRHLADSLYHSAVVVTWASTMIIDAVVFDKPVVLVGFDATRRPYGFSIQQYYDYDHQRKILASGGVRFAKTPEALADTVRDYLENPRLDSEGRERIRRDYVGLLGRQAGERLGRLLLTELGRAKV